tara:strand:- start:622 stop:867 length:246 start_codon:yes stop_codon:yes gene_type:complete
MKTTFQTSGTVQIGTEPDVEVEINFSVYSAKATNDSPAEYDREILDAFLIIGGFYEPMSDGLFALVEEQINEIAERHLMEY